MNQVQNELKHYGVLGMKWGVRKDRNKRSFRPRSVRSALANRQNAKVDRSFKDWDENKKKRENATELGKKANLSKLASQRDPSNKSLRSESQKDAKAFKKALKQNTAYRQGAVRQDVGRDAARKYLSEAKKVRKELDKDPSNKQLKKQYDKLMSEHAIERAKARKALEVGQRRSAKIASLKRARTIAIKGVAATAALSAGTIGANAFLKSRGHQGLTSESIQDIIKAGKKLMRAAGYIY